ncbi:sodium ion-translocating decarboxylase subunit beta, partial [Alishewanella sp. SMS9]|nr:sodium ion-translocating decarboxylase subunit beta [Alishewanella sp. SMS9]
MEAIQTLIDSTGLVHFSLGQIIMMLVGVLLLFLAIAKGFEPLLLVPIGFGAILTNVPLAGMGEPGGVLYLFYDMGIT